MWSSHSHSWFHCVWSCGISSNEFKLNKNMSEWQFYLCCFSFWVRFLAMLGRWLKQMKLSTQIKRNERKMELGNKPMRDELTNAFENQHTKNVITKQKSWHRPWNQYNCCCVLFLFFFFSSILSSLCRCCRINLNNKGINAFQCIELWFNLPLLRQWADSHWNRSENWWFR